MRIFSIVGFALIATVGLGNDVPQSIRVATFNVSLFGQHAGDVADRLADGADEQAEKIVSIIQAVRPDVLLVNELDYDREGRSVAGLIAMLRGGEQPIDYPFWVSPPSNTGVASGADLDGDGVSDGPGDAFGFGTFPGQYAFAILSRFPIDAMSVRYFGDLKWSELPQPKIPTNPDGTPYYEKSVWSTLRLSSKNHVDVPVKIGDRTLHVLASHPTPPVFDGPEDRNGCRNHDEIRFWNHYMDGDLISAKGPIQLSREASFVIAGDLNSDPTRGDSIQSGIVELINHRRVADVTPLHDGEDTTALFGERKVRVDYVLPSTDLTIVQSGVFWPTRGDAADLVSASDHRLVWIEVQTNSIHLDDH